jgi:hypothetical protein
MGHVGFWDSITRDLSGRGIFGGSHQIRLLLQPFLAIVLGVRFGIRDAREGRRPFFMRLVESKSDRWTVLKEGLRAAIIPLALSLILDGVLQHMINGRVRPLVAVIVGTLLVFLPFVLARGWTNRIWTHSHHVRPRHAP